MGTISMYSFSARDLEEVCTDAKNMVLAFLLAEGKLTEDECVEYVEKYAFVVRKPSFFEGFFNRNKKKSKDDKGNAFYIVKIQDRASFDKYAEEKAQELEIL